ncbi:MAG: DUF4998 domain-containing protein [Fermentimonas sp.]|jgi:hypothetical protein
MKIKYLSLISVIMTLLFSCESMDDNYKEYLGEYNYSGKIDSLRVYPGFERVILAWDNPKDQKSKKIRIVYGADSTEIIYDQLVDSVSIDNLTSGAGYEFTIYTMDNSGNLSVPTSVTAFPISAEHVANLTPPSLIVDVKDNEQVISLIGLSNVQMKFAGKISYTLEGPGGIKLSDNLDLTDQITETNSETGAKQYKTINEYSLPVAELGGPLKFFPPGTYNFKYSTSVWPLVGNMPSIDIVKLDKETTIDVKPIIINITSLGGKVSDKYNTTGGEGIEKVRDGNENTKYLCRANNTWIVFEPTNPAIVTKYTLTTGNDAPGRDPKDWKLEASNDGNNWVTLDEKIGYNFGAPRKQTHTFEIPDNDQTYKYYRLNVTKNAGESLFQLAEWTLYGPKLM